MKTRSVGAVCICLVVVACNYDEAELFVEGDWFPGIPDTGVTVCNECMQVQCLEARADCVAHEACAERLACSAACRDPDCINACDAEALARERQCEAASGGIGSVPCAEGFERISGLARCAQTNCKQECNVGHNWGCFNDYAWKAVGGAFMSGEQIFVRHKVDSFGDQNFLAGIPEVDISESRGGFETHLETTDAWGWAEFELGIIGGSAPHTLRLFGRDPSFPVRGLLHLGRPRVRSDALRNLNIVPNKYAFLYRDKQPDPTKANVAVLGIDCLGASWGVSPQFIAFDVDIELTGATWGTSCHWDNVEFHRCDVSAGNIGQFLDVTPTGGPVNAVMRRTSDGTIVGRTSNLVVEPGWTTLAFVLPLAIE